MKEVKQSVRDAIEWYKVNRSKYENLCNLVKNLIEKLLKRMR